MNLDGITLHSAVEELSQALTGGQITKIYQLNGRGLYFRVFNDKSLYHLIITLDGSPRLFLSDSQPPTPDVPTGLAMFLRKYYENGRIASITQLHLDRIIDVNIDVLNMSGQLVTRKMHVELMGKYSNVIFTEDGMILEALIKTHKDKQALRTIYPKHPYEFPPNFMRMNPFDFSVHELTEMADTGDSDEDLRTWMLKRFNGMSTVVLNELSDRTGIDINTLMSTLTAEEKNDWFSAVIQLGKDIQGLKGAFVYTDQKKEILFPAELKSLAHLPRRHYDYIQDYLKEFQDTAASLSGEQEELKKKAAKAADRQRRKIRRINSELKETDKMDTYKLYGDLLMIHAYDRPAHQSSLTVRNLLSETMEDVTIPLNPALSVTDNANKYYKKYAKLRNRKQMSAQLQADNAAELNYIESLEYALQTIETKDELADIKAEMRAAGMLPTSGKDKLKKEFAQKILTLHCDGANIFIGRNNRQNDFLTTKKAKPFDCWFHVKNRPGSHVILSCGQDEPTNKQLQTAAECAAWYSTGRDDSKVEVDSTMIKHVKKPPHSVPGYVIFDHQTTYVVTPKKHDELSK